MNHTKHTKQITTLLVAAIVASLCQPTIDTSAASIKLNKTKIQLTQGKTTTLKVKGTKKKAKWSIKSGKKCLKLQKKRKASVKIKALKVGTAKVQCKIGFWRQKTCVNLDLTRSDLLLRNK